jgi:hypothetical protein
MMNGAFAILYAALAALPAAMHIALAAGAPLGRFTLGGRFPHRLPPAWRLLALLQAALLAGMAAVVLGRGTVIVSPLPDWLFWPVAGLTVLTFGANAASPSPPERRLWGPVTLGMVVAVLGTALL